MLLGHDKLIKSFKRLADDNSLFHAYLFVGEKGIGKFSFARSLGNYLENGEFDLPPEDRVLSETLVIKKTGKENIGIDQVREIRHFLSEKPLKSRRRLVIIDEAETFSDRAGDAVLKITEEPPENGLIILVAGSPESVLRTIKSRTQSVYFKKVPRKETAEWLEKEKGIKKSRAEELAEKSFGKPGLALKMEKEKELYSFAESFIKNPAKRQAMIRGMLKEENADVPEFLEALLAVLRSAESAESFRALGAITETMTKIMDYTLNKRLQLEAMANNF